MKNRISMKKVMGLAAGILAMTLSSGGFAAGGSSVKLDHVEVNLSDMRSLQNGAKLFVNYCLSCHSAEFMRYNRMAKDLEIPEKLVKDNMMFGNAKIGDPMTTTMSREDGEAWFGVAPPDLSLTSRLRGADWIYSYLRAFHLDENTVSGWNNTVFENVAMPHVLYELQNSMSEEEYDGAARDITNFMVYLGEPAKMVRGKYGAWVLMFLALFGVLAYMLKKEYWRDVH